MELKQLRNHLERQKGQQSQIALSLKRFEEQLKSEQIRLEKHEKAREIVRIVGLKTQQQLQFQISDVTSVAMDAVFDNPYTLKVDFVQRRNKTECDLLFVRDGMEMDPLDSSGGGTIDVASFALRMAAWSMKRPHTRDTILLDEPFKMLKGVEKNRRALEMIKRISHEMEVQIIMVSDERIPREDIITAADRVFEVSIENGVSKIKVS
jgi:DNA repair exonuclease SbcCD ATPase subunit